MDSKGIHNIEDTKIDAAFKTANGIARIVGRDKAIINLKNKIKQIAKSKATVMILGESGTGKELIARAIHEKRQKKNGQIIPVD